MRERARGRRGLRGLPGLPGFVACALCVALAGPSRAARADDWLERLDVCAYQSDRPLPALALIYPREGLPALVAAGDTLVARVHVPAALTPPPGVQQERVLRAWGAELSGAAIVLPASAAPRPHKHVLSALNLRPDAALTLVYRVSFVVPAYALPGTYSLSVQTPFGVLRAPASVRVIEQGAAPRVALAPAVEPSRLPLLAALPIDVWLLPPSAAGAPVEPPAPQAVASELRELGLPARLAASSMGFSLRLGAAARLERSCGESAAVSGASQLASAPPLPTADAVRVTREPDALVIDNRSASPLELTLSIPVGFRVQASGASLMLRPLSDVRVRRGIGLAARLSVPASTRARLRTERTDDARADYVISPSAAIAGHPLVLRVDAAPSGARVAYDLGEGRSAWSSATLDTAFAAPGGHRVSALVVAPDGSARAARGQLWVRPETPAATCSLAAPAPAPARTRPSAVFTLLLFASACLLKRRALLRFGNRLGPKPRSAPVIDPAMHQPIRSLVLASSLLLALFAAAGCDPDLIPNTRVEDTEANREVLDFVEKYRKAVEERNVASLLSMASQNYFDDMGTPAGDDDIDYDGLKAGLERIRAEVLGARYQVSYRAVTYAADRKVLVDILYTGWFRVTTPKGPEWKRHLEPHRIVLAREESHYKILSGM